MRPAVKVCNRNECIQRREEGQAQKLSDFNTLQTGVHVSVFFFFFFLVQNMECQGEFSPLLLKPNTPCTSEPVHSMFLPGLQIIHREKVCCNPTTFPVRHVLSLHIFASHSPERQDGRRDAAESRWSTTRLSASVAAWRIDGSAYNFTQLSTGFKKYHLHNQENCHDYKYFDWLDP